MTDYCYLDFGHCVLLPSKIWLWLPIWSQIFL